MALGDQRIDFQRNWVDIGEHDCNDLLDIFVRQTREVLEKRPREQQPER